MDENLIDRVALAIMTTEATIMRDADRSQQSADPRALARAAIKTMNEWQPIETAPQMTAVLLYAAGCLIGHFNTTNNKWWTETDGTATAGERNLNSWNKPTHWMPLPEPPPKAE